MGFILVHSEYMTGIGRALKDQVLFGHAFRNLTIINAVECFMFCQQERICKAFQMCRKNKDCQLLSSNQFQSPSAFVTMIGCTYYDTQSVNTQMSSRKSSCAMEYCQNGGTAITISEWDKSRQRCICVPGYTGRYCQHVVKSCRRYSNSRTSGQYKVFDDNMNLFDVFCDFDSNSTTAWTLVQSYQLQNYHKFMKSFNLDNPINENTPRWDFYSLSKSRMESIRNDSSKWRITCEYDTEGVVYTDYMEGWNDIIDIMTNSRTSGQYKVFDDNMNLFDVFCDFDSNSTTAWTLVQSYQLQNYHKFMKSFNLDNPINENTPRWDFYSLSKSRMESIRNDSSKWRITCEYDTEGVVYTDYMEGWNDIIDIMTYEQFSPSFVCSLDKHKIDYVDVRGQNCRNCTVPIIQAPYNPLHLDTYFSMCDFKPTKSLYCDSAGEDNFGRYLCTNPNHRCSSFPTATTQTWFGSP
ncbi:Sphingomyelinase phosphodiesterase D [Paramuricea clavata]|uniref:Sphingomyelinase phosphodiesterase D n=1 Tax=Paramuricea clavata TaxID=317549 RepID=A0A6S7H0A6_PARCT|nr:Sphingomyelinase phosphodiesterase D [Paramuricea clavata]